MLRRINIKDVNGVKEFVKAAESSDSTVLVSKEGFRFQVDGASFLGMMSLVANNLIVNCESNNKDLAFVLDKYAV